MQNSRLAIELKKERDKYSSLSNRYEKALMAILDGTFLTEEQLEMLDESTDAFHDQLNFIDEFIKESLSK